VLAPKVVTGENLPPEITPMLVLGGACRKSDVRLRCFLWLAHEFTASMISTEVS
jgi:hypothetical protein